MENQKIKSIFLGKVTETTWVLQNNRRYNEKEYWSKPILIKSTKTSKREIIEEIEMDEPPFKKDQEVFLNKLKKYATIEKVARSTDGSMVYNITYVIENKEIPISDKIKQQFKDEIKLYNEWKVQKDTRQEEQQKIKEKNKLDKLYICELLGFITKDQKNIINDLYEDNNFERALIKLRDLEKDKR